MLKLPIGIVVTLLHAALIPDELEACLVQSAVASDFDLCSGVWHMTMQAVYNALCLHPCALTQ